MGLRGRDPRRGNSERDSRMGDPRRGYPGRDSGRGYSGRGDPRRGNSRRGNSRRGYPGRDSGRGYSGRGDPRRGYPRGGDPRRGNPKGSNPRMGSPRRGEPIKRETQKRNKLRSIFMICLILAFVVGVVIGVTQILDFEFSPDDNQTSNITYVDVTNNLSYYENLSQDDVSQDNNSDSDYIYNNSNVKVINSSD